MLLLLLTKEAVNAIPTFVMPTSGKQCSVFYGLTEVKSSKNVRVEANDDDATKH